MKKLLASLVTIVALTCAAHAEDSTMRFEDHPIRNPQPAKDVLASIWADEIGPHNASLAQISPTLPAGENAPMDFDVVRFATSRGELVLSVITNVDKCTYDGPPNTDNYPRLCPARLTTIVNGKQVTSDISGLVCSITGNDGIDPKKVGVWATYDPSAKTITIVAKSPGMEDGTAQCIKTIPIK